jgi:hypothetical protein
MGNLLYDQSFYGGKNSSINGDCFNFLCLAGYHPELNDEVFYKMLLTHLNNKLLGSF